MNNFPAENSNSRGELPVASALDAIVAAIEEHGAAVITSPPGSGKTTLIPPALLDAAGVSGKILLLQPRRIAARSVARRIAQLRGVPLGDEVGYQVRFERAVSAKTRLIVETTGVLLRRLIDDLALPGIGAIFLDEFHERTIEQDLCLGVLRRVQQTIRPDLKLIVMSATLATGPVARLLGDCPVLDVTGRVYPVDIRYQRRRSTLRVEEILPDVLDEAVDQTTGHVLVFLPGVGEIRECERGVAPLAKRRELSLFSLYGEQRPEEQDSVLAPSTRRKVILATNIAETSLTIEGVTAVIDSGYAKQMQMDPSVGLPKLVRVSISKASADQRAGRAGRLMPGICWRLWEAAAHAARRDFDAPEVLRMDLSSAVLTLLHWGERDVAAFPWLDLPTGDAVQIAVEQLRWLGAIHSDGQLTTLGTEMVGLPLHPRLARLLIAGRQRGLVRHAATAAALLSERDVFRGAPSENSPRRESFRSECDICDRVQVIHALDEGREPPVPLPVHPRAMHNILRAAQQLERLVGGGSSADESHDEPGLRRCILDAFPDRLAQLRAGSRDRGLMVGGRGVRLSAQSNVRPERLFVCVDVDAGSGDAQARLVTSIERDWLDAAKVRSADEFYFHPTRRQIEMRRRNYWGDLMLEETPAPFVATTESAALLARHAASSLEQILPEQDSVAHGFRRRVQWLSKQFPDLQLPALDDEQIRQALPDIAAGLQSFAELRAVNWLHVFQSIVGPQRIHEIDRWAPSDWTVPSGNRVRIEYDSGTSPSMSVRIQELFGIAETPRIAQGRVALRLQLLGPNYRPQQITEDLASFWKNAYPQIKAELRRRYPKHAWPDDPRTAQPTRSGLKRDQK